MRGLPLAAFFALAATANPAAAVVTQVDGTLVPVGNAIQTGLNRGENGAPYTSAQTPPNPIDPIGDASETPEIFAVPSVNGKFGKVQFIDLQEGGAFENTFGWYNVGDDLSDVKNNLHEVVTCWDYTKPNTPWTGDFEPTGNTGGFKSIAEVDFAAEFAAGRYKGGFIGFFLISPDWADGYAHATDFTTTGDNATTCPSYRNNQVTSDSSKRACPTEAMTAYCRCGRVEPSRSLAEQRCIGRIFYTEKLINGDGNYVHYLNYQTRLTTGGARRNDFYFGFEDRFRGNDNDFEDQLLLVKGLDVPCVPSAEICDGKDNNCDGKVDNNTVDAGLDCGDQPNTWGTGKCKPGVSVCANGKISCTGQVLPSAETCNGVDDNCNQQIDDGVVPTGTVAQVCAGQPTKGQCTAKVACVGGVEVCEAGKGPEAEKCNGLDDDCDGSIDNAPVDIGQPCGTSAKGVCKLGVFECGPCSPGDADCRVCVGAVGPSAEVCNGLDDDCNGLIDDGVLPGVGDSCGGGAASECQGTGALACVNGELKCEGVIGASAEVCDGKDNNCDGKIDNDPVDVGFSCGQVFPPCLPGKTVCKSSGGTATVECEAPESEYPQGEVCNGIDDNCDGSIDNLEAGVEGSGDACSTDENVDVSTLQKGSCKPGALKCVGGAMQCLGGQYPSEEICDGVDNDCDGQADDQAPCPTGLSCIDGACRQTCKNSGEFNDCPGGQECVSGVCRVIDCTGKCQGGLVCNQKSGLCEKDTSSGGASGKGGSSSSPGGSGGTGEGGAAGENGEGGASGENGEAGDAGETPGGNEPTIQRVPKNYALTTGGCSVGAESRSASGTGLFALVGLGLALAFRRRRGEEVVK
jgi:Notch 1